MTGNGNRTPRPPSLWERRTGLRPPRNLRELIARCGDSRLGRWLKAWAVLREADGDEPNNGGAGRGA